MRNLAMVRNAAILTATITCAAVLSALTGGCKPAEPPPVSVRYVSVEDVLAHTSGKPVPTGRDHTGVMPDIQLGMTRDHVESEIVRLNPPYTEYSLVTGSQVGYQNVTVAHRSDSATVSIVMYAIANGHAPDTYVSVTYVLSPERHEWVVESVTR